MSIPDQEDYSIRLSDEETDILKKLSDWLTNHQMEKDEYGFWTKIDVNDPNRCARQKQVQAEYIEENVESSLKRIIELINSILLISQMTPVAPTEEFSWLTYVGDVKRQPFDVAQEYCRLKKEKLLETDADTNADIIKALSLGEELLPRFLSRLEEVYAVLPRKLSQRITVESDMCANKAIEDIIASNGAAHLKYSPRVYPDGGFHAVYSLDNVDPDCELAHILNKVKAGLESRGFIVTSLTYPSEDAWYSSIYADIEREADRAARMEKEVNIQKLSLEEKRKREQKRLQTQIECLKEDIGFFLQPDRSDPFYDSKLKSRLRSFKNTHAEVKSILESDTQLKANKVIDKLKQDGLW